MIIVAGENVVDLVTEADERLRPTLGGGPANVAVTAAQLGAPVAMVARFGADRFGRAFVERLTAAGVDLRYARQANQPSTLALASLNDGGHARYDFWLASTADFGWSDAQLPDLANGDVIHFGSLAAFRPPGAAALEGWVGRHRGICTICFDPNLREAALAPDRPAGLARLHRLVEAADVVKLSRDDLALAYPDRPAGDVIRTWLDAGPRLVVLTNGGAGMVGFTNQGTVSVPALDVPVVDTIGAGDAVSGALLVWLARVGLAGLLGDLPAALRYAAAVAGLTCTRAGAHPPTAAEAARVCPGPPS